MNSKREIRWVASPYQERVLSIPYGRFLALAGGRGGGKTKCSQFAIGQYITDHPGVECLVIRATKASTGPYFLESKSLLEIWFGKANVRANQQKGLISVDHKGVVSNITFGHLQIQQDLDAFQGMNVQFIIMEEAGQLKTWVLFDQLLAILRSANGIPTSVYLNANPGGAGERAFYNRFLRNRKPWTEYEDSSGRKVVICPSTVDDNPHLTKEYQKQFDALLASRPELYEQWRLGLWGAGLNNGFFANSFDPVASVIPNFSNGLPAALQRVAFPSTDWASTSVAYTLFFARSGHSPIEMPSLSDPTKTTIIPPNSIVIFDEINTMQSIDEPDVGDNTSAGQYAASIVARCDLWNIQRRGPCDSSIFQSQSSEQQTIAKLMRKEGLHVKRCIKKRRLARLQVIKQYMQQSGKPGKPGLYITANCTDLLALIPLATRSKNNPEDMAQTGDHWADALAYALACKQGGFRAGTF
tara:strand:- start:18750 stop:20159 length:1410 start_codon:yes stop_codon:yes gene_type:complete